VADVEKPGSQGAGEQRRNFSFILLGALSLIPYAYAFYLQDLRAKTTEFEIAFYFAFVLYAIAVALVLRQSDSQFAIRNSQLAIVFGFAILFRTILVFTPPTLSDDMYRYVWDGRVQAQGINPYAYPPSASQLESLRDDAVWQHVNRKDVVTVYPAGAEISYALLWRIVPNNVRWFQIAMAAGDLIAGALLILLLRALKLPDLRALIFLWNPLVIFETAHAAHVDGIVLPFLVAAFLARAKNRDALTGAMLGLATALKLYPVILFPALWRVHDEQGRWRIEWRMPIAFVGAFVLPYLAYLSQGASVIGFLPNYFDERFNMGLAGIITNLIEKPPAPIFVVWSQAVGGSAPRVVNMMLAATLLIISITLVVRPSRDARDALHRCLFPIGAFTLLTQNLFPWYMLWLIPLVALFIQRGKLGLHFDAWTGWFLFTGLVVLAYTFFIDWQPLTWAILLEFVPLYAILILSYFYPDQSNAVQRADN
jgi:alpha-1,6-mannosyltransferase